MTHDYCDGDGAAYARPGTEHSPESKGLTKREYFAALAMQGFLSNATALEALIEMPDVRLNVSTARGACEFADALIAELNKNE